MRISDWSSDVCSSDLEDFDHRELAALFHPQDHPRRLAGHAAVAQGVLHQHGEHLLQVARVDQHGQGRYAVAELDLVQVGRDGFEVVVEEAAHEDGQVDVLRRSEEHTSELQAQMRTSYAVFGWKKKND